MIEDKRFTRMNTAVVKQYEEIFECNQKNIEILTTENKRLIDVLNKVKTEYFKNNVIILENTYEYEYGHVYEIIIQLPEEIECICNVKLNSNNEGKTHNIFMGLSNKHYNKLPNWYFKNTKYIKYGFESFELAKEAILLELENLCLEIQKLRD